MFRFSTEDEAVELANSTPYGWGLPPVGWG